MDNQPQQDATQNHPPQTPPQSPPSPFTPPVAAPQPQPPAPAVTEPNFQQSATPPPAQSWQPPQPQTAPSHEPTFAPPMHTPTVKKGPNKMVVLIVMIAVAVAAIGTGVYFLFFNGGNSLIGALTGTADVVDRRDGTLDLSNLIDNQKTIKEQTVKGKINQQLNLSSGVSYMVTGVDRNVTSSSSFVKPKAGKELIKVNIVVGNRDKDTNMYVALSDFQLRNSAGGLQSPAYVTANEIAGALESQDLASGKQIKGALVFEVDKNEKVSALVTDDTYQLFGSGSSDKEIAVKSEVSL